MKNVYVICCQIDGKTNFCSGFYSLANNQTAVSGHTTSLKEAYHFSNKNDAEQKLSVLKNPHYRNYKIAPARVRSKTIVNDVINENIQ